ncbi:MAG: hypothetical protein ACOY4T_12510 [Pseudomonadota bacterium]
MRILSARVTRARRNSGTSRAEAVVALLVADPDGSVPVAVRLAVSAPLRAPGAAPLRDRLIAAAKLTYAATPRALRTLRYAA